MNAQHRIRTAVPLAALTLATVAPVTSAHARSCNPPRITIARDETVSQMPRFNLANANTIDPRPADIGMISQFTDADYSNHYVRDVVVDPADANRLYIVNADTMQRSDDGGCTWREVYHLPHLGTDPTVATAETNRLVQVVVTKPAVYVVAMPFHGAAGYEALPGERVHVLRSTDGRTFTAVDTGIAPLPGYAKLSALPDGRGPLYLDLLPFDPPDSTDYGSAAILYRSSDGAATWTPVNEGAPAPDACCWIDPVNPNDLWATVGGTRSDRVASEGTPAATGTSMAHSVDGGATFATVRPLDDTADYTVLGLSHRPGRPARLVLRGLSWDTQPDPATGTLSSKPHWSYAFSDDAGRHVQRLPDVPAGFTPATRSTLDDAYGYNALNYAQVGSRDDQFAILMMKTGPSGICYQAVSYDGHRAKRWRQLTRTLDPDSTANQYCQPTILVTAPGQRMVRYLVPTWTGSANVQLLVSYSGLW